ncbi:MAG: hypothetical protein IJ695_03450 [Butyrivibrio sp.]|nr:hypothetical protein [Butyrivibrio sp.]
MSVVITAKLSLALRLIDTTTGKEVDESGISFFLDGNRLIPMKKGEGVFVFVNIGREDFLMQIDAPGYEKADVDVNHEKLDPRLPMLDIFLMPSEKNRVGGSVLELNGTLKGLTEIEAIRLDRPIGLFQSAQSRKEVHSMNILPVRAGGGCMLDQIAYALLSEDEERYDVFTVQQQNAPLSIILKEPVETEHKLNDKIFRIIYGRASPDGKFRLKVRDDSSTLPYLLRIKVGEEVYFKKIDFHETNGKITRTELLKGAAKKESVTEPKETEETKDE